MQRSDHTSLSEGRHIHKLVYHGFGLVGYTYVKTAYKEGIILLWRPVGILVQFIIGLHPTRGLVILFLGIMKFDEINRRWLPDKIFARSPAA